MKNQPTEESKILLSEYRNTFVQKWVDSGLVDSDQAMLMINQIQDIAKTFLTCTSCTQVLPDEDFYLQKTCVARRGRAAKCKACWRENHTKPKGFR